MRATRLTSLVMLWTLLSVSWCLADAPNGKSPRTFKRTRVPGEKIIGPNPWIVRGFGETRRDAEQHALSQARDELLTYLDEEGLHLETRPTVGEMRRLVRESEEEEPKEIEGLGSMRQVRMRLELSTSDYDVLLLKDRDVRAQQRMLGLGKSLAGLVALLAAVAGYFRLEEATKGYYTTWLRLAAVGFLAAIGAGLWLAS